MKYEIMLSILFELLSNRGVSAKTLAQKYEVSERSIYRYVNCIELAGVPIYTTRGRTGGFSIVDTYRLSSTFMTSAEFEQTINALNGLCETVPNKELASAILKLKAVRKKEYDGFNVKSGNLIIDAGPWGDAIYYKAKLKAVSTCIEKNLQLFIKYHDRNGQISERVIDPHVIVLKQGLWYVFAYCHLRNEFRFFKTGRIENATVLTEHFVRQDISKMDLPLDFWHSETEVIDVKIEVSKQYLSDVAEWLGVENITEENGKIIGKAKLPDDEGLVSKLMSFSGGIKVIEPMELKKKIKTRAQELLDIYE